MNGLTSSEVLESRKKYGANKIPEKPLKKWNEFFFETFKDGLNLILLGMMVAFCILAVTGNGSFSEPAGVGVVLIAIAIISTNTGLKSQKATKELRDKTSVHYCNVIRDGQPQHINTDELVVGDLVIIQAGEGIYADGYLVEGHLSVDNSVLNGESEPCKKSVIDGFVYKDKETITGNDYIDKNSLFAGAIILDGEGRMLVTKVGVDTVNGKTIATMQDIEEQKTSLQMQLDDLCAGISKFGTIAALVIIAVNVLSRIFGGAWFDMKTMELVKDILTIATTALTIVVAAVPEGLPLIITLITAQNAKVMIKHNVLAKNTNKIPEAGNIQLLCTDKTGTLTGGKLVPIHNVTLDNKEIEETDAIYTAFSYNVCLNTSAVVDANGKVEGGNMTERALIPMINPDRYKHITQTVKVVNKKPFNSAYKFSAIQFEDTDGTKYALYKGAPERLLAVATKYADVDGNVHDIDKASAQKLIEGFMDKAMRVIAFGTSLSDISDTLPDDLVITSLVAIRDDVRKEVPAAVRKMHNAGVHVMMVTGDNIKTATAIAKEAGLFRTGVEVAMNATEFDALVKNDREGAKKILPEIVVIARATPETKLNIVQLAQEMKICVGMTGDGTNDSPALKGADVGFSMGSGTDVCKEAGDIIITDDNFVSITDAVLLGRTFMHNVHMFLKFQLPINVGLVILSVLYPVIFGITAIAAVQILVINIVMDSLNSLSFGGEPAKEEYMFEKPIPKGSPLLDKDTIIQIGVSTTTLVALFAITWIPAVRELFGTEAQYATARFALLIIAATINGFNIRTDGFNLFEGIEKNTMFIKIAISIFAGTFLLAQFGGEMLHCSALSAGQWLIIVLLSLLVIPVDFARKAVLKSKK